MVISLAISAIGAFLAFFWQSDTQCEEYFIILYIRCIYWILTFVSTSPCDTIHQNIITIQQIFSVIRSHNQISSWTITYVWLSWILSSYSNPQRHSIAYSLTMEYCYPSDTDNNATSIWTGFLWSLHKKILLTNCLHCNILCVRNGYFIGRARNVYNACETF